MGKLSVGFISRPLKEEREADFCEEEAEGAGQADNGCSAQLFFSDFLKEGTAFSSIGTVRGSAGQAENGSSITFFSSIICFSVSNCRDFTKSSFEVSNEGTVFAWLDREGERAGQPESGSDIAFFLSTEETCFSWLGSD